MKIRNYMAGIFLLLMLHALGCRSITGPPTESGVQSVDGTPAVMEAADNNLHPDPDTLEDANSYYLYLESQFQRKKGDPERAVFFLELAAARDPDSLFLIRELVVLYLQQSENEKALDIMQRILAAEPDNIDAMIMTATIMKSLQRDAEAIVIYEKVLKMDPERRNIYHLLGKTYLDGGDMENAFRLFEAMSERFHDDYTGHYYLGQIYQAKEEPEKAETSFLKALEKAPYLVEPRLELIRIYEKTGQELKLITVYEEILTLYPDNIPTSIELGLLYHKNNRIESAEAIFSRMGRQSLEDPNIMRTLLQNLILQERDKDALIILKQMLAEVPENTEIQYMTGVVYENLGDLDAAVQQFQTIATDTRYYPNAALHLAIIYYKQGDTDKGMEVLEAAMGIVPETEKIQIIPYLASFYKEKEMIDQARALVSAGLEIEPDNPGLLYEMGVIYDRMGNTDAAMEQMTEVIRLDPDHADALNYIGYTYAEKGINLEEAERLIIKALSIKPENGYILDSLGWVYYQRGRFEEALIHLERAVELVPEDPIILEHLGDLYMKLAQPGKAIKIYERALLHWEKDTDGIQRKIDALRQEGF
jgi:tetratricopeptide (TPR) repeat protein